MAKGKCASAAANRFVKETRILDKLKNSKVKIINKNWNNLGDVLECLKSGFYSAKFQQLETKDMRLEIEEILTSEAYAE